jgi:VanZ family protein
MLKRVLQNLLFRAPAVLYAAALFFASSRSRLPLPDVGIRYEDKLLHMLAYAAFSLLLYLALTRPHPVVRHGRMWAVAIGVVYAASDEWHQWFVPGRFAEGTDLAADAVGLVGAQLVLWWRARSRRADRL